MARSPHVMGIHCRDGNEVAVTEPIWHGIQDPDRASPARRKGATLSVTVLLRTDNPDLTRWQCCHSGECASVAWDRARHQSPSFPVPMLDERADRGGRICCGTDRPSVAF